MYLTVNKKRFACSVAIIIMCLVGDKNSSPKKHGDLPAAVCDNICHALVGMFVWLGVLAAKAQITTTNFYIQILICGLCSSAIDLDHFISAKSFSLRDAINLSQRPPFHCTSGTLIVGIIVIWFAIKMGVFWLYQFGWILVVAILSHHIRDSNRRGLWIWPFGSTEAVPYALYILCEALLPHGIHYLMSLFPFPAEIQTYERGGISVV